MQYTHDWVQRTEYTYCNQCFVVLKFPYQIDEKCWKYEQWLREKSEFLGEEIDSE